MKTNKFKIIGILSAIVLLSVILFFSCRKNKAEFNFETAKASRGMVNNSVTATGTVQAIKTVAVGTQVSGVISKIYADFNSHVKKGQLLAEIDKAPLMTNLESSQAALDDANAELVYQTANYNRTKALFDKQLVAQTDYDLALYNYQKTKAGVKTAQTNYDRSKINLDYATIYSPIDGVVLNRAVDEGQTVAASFNTPTLFSIANDLTQMQVEANIDEADIGQIRDAQKVEFTVDAFPEEKFKGEVTEIRLQPVTTSNVVTYTVIVKAPNPELKLMPGMTANITVIINESRKNTLVIPGKAIRFSPDSSLVALYNASLSEKDRTELKDSPKDSAKPKSNNGMKMPAPADSENTDKPMKVWVKNGKTISPKTVEIGINDGINAEVLSGINEGDEVIISMTSNLANGANPKISSPFMPHPPKRK
jgi:HlyD family secretion protein